MRGTYSDRYEGLQIKIESKILKSGKCQVRFQTSNLAQEDFYGYALVEGEKTLREVVAEIKRKLKIVGSPHQYYQRNLYAINRYKMNEIDFVIFKS
jgi:hypothetical protein